MIASTSFVGVAFGNDNRNDRDIEKIKVGISPEYYLYCYKNNDDYIGFNIDVIKTLAILSGFEIEFVEVPSNEMLLYLITDRADIIMGMDYRHIPKEYISTTRPFNDSIYSIFVRRDNATIKTMDDLQEASVIYCLDDPFCNIIKNKIEAKNKIVTNNINEAYSVLNSEYADAYIGDKYLFTDYLYSMDDKNLFRSTGDVNEDWLTTIVALSKNDDIINKINDNLLLLNEDETIDELVGKWFGKNLIDYNKVINNTINITMLISLSSLLIAIVIFILNRHLKKQIKDRTNDINNEKIMKESIIDSMISGLVCIDKIGIILSENHAAREILDEKTLLKRNFYYLKHSNIVDKKLIQIVLENGDKLENLESTYKKDGLEKSIKYNLTPVYNDKNDIIGVTIVFMDVTEEKRMMKKLIQKDKLETIGRLTASIAHEIRNPLTSIDMYVKLLPEKINSASFRNQIVEDIPKEIDRLNSIIQDVLDYATPRNVERVSFNLKEEVDMVMRLAMNQIRKYDINISVDIDEKIDVLFDEYQFKQVIINLVINSIDELKNINNPSIIIESKVSNDKVYLEIMDNGRGISAELKDKIYEPFFTTKAEGHGLGLMIVRQIMDDNNADIYLDDNYLNGAKFIIEMDKGK